MTVDDADPVRRRLNGLEVLTSNERRAERLREKCRSQMRRAPTPRRVLGLVLFTGLCVIYLSALVLDVLRLQGML